MQAVLNRILRAMSAAIVLVDGAWLVLGHSRYDGTLSGVLACAAFLIVFPAGCALLSYLLVTIAGPRVDEALAAADRAIGFDWRALMAFVADYPRANALLGLAYLSVMPQTVVLIFALGFSKKTAELYRFSLALTLGAAITLAMWTIIPSFGAFSVYTLPDPVASKLGLALGFDYGHALVQMLKDGPGFISPNEMRGIVGFPSYHTLQALVLAWYARELKFLRWPAVALNLVCLVAIPIQGGHHLMDLFGGAAVTLVSIALAGWIVRWAAAAREPAQAPSVKPSFTPVH